MGCQEEYTSIDKLEEVFDIEQIIQTTTEFDDYINNIGCYNTYYRGVITAKYKMFNSAQRFYHNHKKDLQDIPYHDFISYLYQISAQLDNGYLKTQYERQFNCIRYRNICKLLGYNPIWAYSALQHFTQCSPMLDFSSSFDVALYFAVNGSHIVSSNPLDNYFSIIKFTEDSKITNNFRLNGGNRYSSYIENLLDKIDLSSNCSCRILNNAKSAIEQCDIMEIEQDEIQYVTYNYFATTLNKNGIDYRISFANDNIVRQKGKLLINNTENIPFEQLWKKVFPERKLKILLIHKSLNKTLCMYLTTRCMCNRRLLPICKDYKKEIIQKLETCKSN